jgi:hypothetical protein
LFLFYYSPVYSAAGEMSPVFAPLDTINNLTFSHTIVYSYLQNLVVGRYEFFSSSNCKQNR